MDAENIESFVSATGASRENAAKYIAKHKGDVDAAVFQYLEDDEAGVLENEAVTAQGRAEANSGEALSPVDAILGGIKGDKGAGKGDLDDLLGKGKGKGKDDERRRTVVIAFFEDGFMVDDEPEVPEQPPAQSEQPAAPAPRRTGMMGLSDLKKETRAQRGPMPKLPKLKPLRSYDTPENKKFLELVKAGRLPEELQKRDESGEIIPVSIGIEDVRPKTYAELDRVIKQMEKMQLDDEKDSGRSAPAKPSTLFSGAGQTLSSSSTSAPAAAPGGGGSAGPGADPSLLALIDAAPAPFADESKPTTTIQLRLSSGSRSQVTLNLDHTVADLWRVVANVMGHATFRQASNHVLSAGFPPKPLTDISLTIEAASLQKAAITHRCS